MWNPFERHYSPTPKEEEKAREEGGEKAVEELEDEFDIATERANDSESDVVEISQEEVDAIKKPEAMGKLIKKIEENSKE